MLGRIAYRLPVIYRSTYSDQSRLDLSNMKTGRWAPTNREQELEEPIGRKSTNALVGAQDVLEDEQRLATGRLTHAPKVRYTLDSDHVADLDGSAAGVAN